MSVRVRRVKRWASAQAALISGGAGGASRALSRRSSFIFRVDRKITVGEKMSIVACVRPHTGELISCLMRARESEQLLEIKAALRSEQLQLHEELRQELRSEQLQLHEELRRQLRREASWAGPTVDSHQWTPTQGNSPFWERPDQSGCEAIPEGQQELAASGGPSPPPSPPTIISRTRSTWPSVKNASLTPPPARAAMQR